VVQSKECSSVSNKTPGSNNCLIFWNSGTLFWMKQKLTHTVSFTLSEVYHDTPGTIGVLQDTTLEKCVDKNNWTLSAGNKFSVTMSYSVTDINQKYLLGMKTLPGTHTKHKLIIFSTYCSEAQKWKEWSIVQSWFSKSKFLKFCFI
jgi:hypothetical protein